MLEEEDQKSENNVSGDDTFKHVKKRSRKQIKLEAEAENN